MLTKKLTIIIYPLLIISLYQNKVFAKKESCNNIYGINQKHPPDTLIDNSTKLILCEINNIKLNDKNINHKVADIVHKVSLDIMDIPSIIKYILGKHIKKFTPSQLKEFTQKFPKSLSNLYSSHLTKMQKATIQTYPAKYKKNKKGVEVAIVNSKITSKDGSTIEIKYLLRKTKNNYYKIFNILVMDLSLIRVLRAKYQNDLSTKTPAEIIKELK